MFSQSPGTMPDYKRNYMSSILMGVRDNLDKAISGDTQIPRLRTRMSNLPDLMTSI